MLYMCNYYYHYLLEAKETLLIVPIFTVLTLTVDNIAKCLHLSDTIKHSRDYLVYPLPL